MSASTVNIIEFKAKLRDKAFIQTQLQAHQAILKGRDHQIDTYFQTPKQGDRLKYREGKIENNLIYYNRSNQSGPKLSEVLLYPIKAADQKQKEILTALLGIKVVVDKQREIYFIENVKIHIDEVKSLGGFVEVEAIDETGQVPKEVLQKQCNYFLDVFQIQEADLLTHSYSDMVLEAGS